MISTDGMTLRQRIVATLKEKPWQSFQELKMKVIRSYKTQSGYVKTVLKELVDNGSVLENVEFDNVPRYAASGVTPPRAKGTPISFAPSEHVKRDLSPPPSGLPWVTYPGDPEVLTELIAFYDAGTAHSEEAKKYFEKQSKFIIALRARALTRK